MKDTMKCLLLITIVLICKTIGKSESRDFCETFEGNGYKVDYTFEHHYQDSSEDVMVIVFIIEYDYWILDYNEKSDTMIVVSKGTSHIFGPHYSSVMSFKTWDNKYIYGFLRRNDFVIEWKELKSRGDSVDYSLMKSTVVSTSNPLKFPQNFEPDFSYWLNTEDMSFYQTFVSQKKMAQKQEFIRDYYVLDFNVFTDTINPLSPQVLANQTRTKTSSGEDFIITCYGTLGVNTYPGDHMYLVVYQKHNSIEYCLLNGTDRKTYSLDGKCLTQRKILFDCNTKYIDLLVYVLIVIVIIAIVAIFCVIGCGIYWSPKFFQTKTSKNKDISAEPSTVDTIKTVDSDTGKPLTDSQRREKNLKSILGNQKTLFHDSVDSVKQTKQMSGKSIKESVTSKPNTSSKPKTTQLNSSKKQSPKK